MSRIEWTDETWNPITGCTRVSEGCRNCYAERMAARLASNPEPTMRRKYGGAEPLAVFTENGPRWSGAVRFDAATLPEPHRWKKPRRVFVCSMSDLFHEDVTDGQILRVLEVCARASHHTFQILTKRPARALAWFRRWADLEGESDRPQLVRGPAETRSAHPSGRGQIFAQYLESMAEETEDGEPPPGCAWPTFDWAEGFRYWPRNFVQHNVWLGTSVEDQATADERLPLLLQIPAAVRFASYEPALEGVDFARLDVEEVCEGCGSAIMLDAFSAQLWCDCARSYGAGEPVDAGRLDWVIAGGESGPGHRPDNLTWYADALAQCHAHGAAFFMKQLAGKREPIPPELLVREWPT